MSKSMLNVGWSTLLGLSALVVGLAAGPGSAAAQTGVSDDRVSLPEGPGSVDGFSDNADVNANMGIMNYTLPIDLPAGHPEATPALTLAYSSGTGNTTLGMGWDMAVPFLERTTVRGLPDYVAGDEFAVSGSNQLVEVTSDGEPTYRSRFERDFTRYTWIERGDGREGYWVAEYSDGSRGYFGAAADGSLQQEARSSGSAGTFRYYLYEKVDRFGHVVRYRYGSSRAEGSDLPLLASVEYGFEGPTPRYRVTLTYEGRDDLISDCKAGFCEITGDRLSLIDVSVAGTAIRRYVLSYEQAGSGGLTRLARVERRGLSNSVFPAVFTFEYSRTLGEQCTDCEGPYFVTMGGTRPGNLTGGGEATLFDIDGDALPDVLNTFAGEHKFYMNVLAADGSQSFVGPMDTAMPDVGAFVLGQGHIQPMDVNGDGFTDLLNRKTAQYLLNDGSGDWASVEDVAGTDALPELDDANIGQFRFLDYDNDKQIDVIRASAGQTAVFRNLGNAAFEQDVNGASLGAELDFESGNVQFTDMNGDGLLDPVKVGEGEILYRLNLGHGQWLPAAPADPTRLELDIQAGDVVRVELEDLNGDELSDVVIVQNDVLRYAINRNGASFDPFETLSEVDGVALPSLEGGGKVLYADMNGNGSNDVVWALSDGTVTYLELFPTRPNLLTGIRNGLGGVTEITYGTSVQQQASSAEPWAYKLTHAMVVVEQTDSYDLLSDNHEVTTFSYRDGFYDGKERRFRGFENVVRSLEEDTDQEASEFHIQYDVGEGNAAFAGLLRSSASFAIRGGESVPMQREVRTYDECDVAEAESLSDFEVTFICETARTVTVQEGAAPAQWVTTRSEAVYDGYGQVTERDQLGVVGTGADGAGACGPCGDDLFGAACGATCTGDEVFSVSTYISPGTDTGDLWLLGRTSRERSYGEKNGDEFTQTDTYYDGDAFVGLAAGQLTTGLATRVVSLRDDSGGTVDTSRSRYDGHGNLVELVDPNGTATGWDHRRIWTFEGSGQRIVRTEIHLEDDNEGRYVLRREFQYDPLWDAPTEGTSWMLVRGDEVVSARNSEYFCYDEFGRTAWRVLLGGDTPESATEVYSYELSSPVSRVRVQRRSETGGELDLESFRCIDGRGREVQRRTRVASGEYLVTGFQVYNKRGSVARSYQAFTSSSGACDMQAPADVLHSDYRYDGLGRVISMTAPDADIYGEASTTRTEYGPLTTTYFDAEDNDDGGSFANTPLVQTVDGLGRLVSLTRQLSPGDTAGTVTVRYDALGNLASVEDPGGHRKLHTYDRLGRLLTVDAPNAGTVSFEYDDAGNLVRQENAQGQVQVSAYDGANRIHERWDPSAEAESKVRWRYDIAGDCSQCENTEGQLVSVRYPLGGSRGTGVDLFGYDPRGNPKYSARSLGGVNFETTYVFDNASRLQSTRYPDGTEVNNVYDDGSRIIAIPGFVDSVRYDDRGQPAGHTLANGVEVERNYDALQRLSGLFTRDAGGSVLQGFSYTHDRVGNIVTVADAREGLNGRATGDAELRYDAYYRLLEYTTDAGSDGAETVSMAYDLIDNLTQKTSSLGDRSASHVGDYTYDANMPNALASAGERQYVHDDAGQMIRRGDTDLEWDYLGHLVGSSNANGAVVAVDYSPTGRVLRDDGGRTYYVNKNFEVRDGVSSVYVRLGRERVARRQSTSLATEVLQDLAPADLDATISAADAYAHGQAGGDRVAAYLRASARRRLFEEEGADTFLHSDHLESLTLATDADGNVRGERLYGATGQLRYTDGHVDPYGYTGQELDPSNDLTHFLFRYLDTSAGRWTSPDPLFLIGATERLPRLGESTTAYAFVANNPFNTVDPTGLSGEGGSGGSSRRSSSASSSSSGAGSRAGLTGGGNVNRRFGPRFPNFRQRLASGARAVFGNTLLRAAVKGALKGAATGAATGAAIGAVVGAVGGGPAGAAAGAGSGAILGSIVGAVTGAIGGVINQVIVNRAATRAGAQANTRLANNVIGDAVRAAGNRRGSTGRMVAGAAIGGAAGGLAGQAVNQLAGQAVPGGGAPVSLAVGAVVTAASQVDTNYVQIDRQ